MVRDVLEFLRQLFLVPVIYIGHRFMKDKPEPVEHGSESRRLWMPPNREIDISIIMPSYNTGEALRPTVDRVCQVFRDAGVGFEVIVVFDGSTDGSQDTLEGAGPEVRIVDLPRNRGKGGALHAGFSRARGAWVGFVDSDGDIDPAHLLEYLRVGQETGADVVYANKKHANSVSASSPFRKFISFGFSSLVGALFALGINDTQTGCKLVKREVMADVLPRLRETQFAFDLELFVASKASGHTIAVAAPVELKERMAGSTVSKNTIFRTLKDALAVLARRHRTETYKKGGKPLAKVYHKGQT